MKHKNKHKSDNGISNQSNGAVQTQTLKPTENVTQTSFNIDRFFVKNLAFSIPNPPEFFQASQTNKSNVTINVQINNAKINDSLYEVTLTLKTTVKFGEVVSVMSEVEQAGYFTMKNVPDEQLKYLLGSYCPSLLFPYAREVVSDSITRGCAIPITIAPVNFDAIYQQSVQKAKEQNDATT